MKTRSYWLAAPLLGALAGPVAAPPAIAKPLLSQQYILSAATPGESSRCLGAAGGPTEPDVVTFPCTTHPDQLWTMTNRGELVNQNNQCIGVAGARVARGAKLVGFRCDGTPNQRWIFNPRVGGWGIFANGANGSQCMTRVVASEKLNHVVLSDCTGDPPQEWTIGIGMPG
jgi:hypothetical protein